MIIYKITNIVNNKVYIGKTKNSLNARWSQHRTENNPTCISHAIQKYGQHNFTTEEIDGANSPGELNYLEECYILKYNSLAPNGYNIMTGGTNPKVTKEKTKRIKIKQIKVKNIMETKTVHSSIKCKICLQVKNRYYAGRYPSGKDSRYIDDTGKEWNGHKCGECQKNLVTQRKRNNAKVYKLLKELKSE